MARIATLILDVNPEAKARAKHGKGFTYTTAKARKSDSDYRLALKQEFKEDPFDTPLYLKAVFYFKKPKSVKRPRPSVKPDIDNVAKKIMDCGNGILWLDDALICKMNVEKRYATSGYIELKMEELID